MNTGKKAENIFRPSAKVNIKPMLGKHMDEAVLDEFVTA